MTDYYPPWSFYYRVEFTFPGKTSKSNDIQFQSMSGLTVEYDMEEFKEGGENRFTHRLPVRTKYSDIVLKRGLLTDSDITAWFLAAFQKRVFSPVNLSVILMNEKGDPLRTWNVRHAIPRKWSVSDFNANENAIAIETLELSYREFSVQ